MAGLLVGACDLHIDGAHVVRCRCWIDLDQGEFAVEDSDSRGVNAGEDRISFHNLIFLTQTGEIRAEAMQVSFARFRPSFGGMNATDTYFARTFDFLSLAPVWRFVCNEPVVLKTSHTAEEVFLRPGKSMYPNIDLACGGRLIGAEHGLCIADSTNFGEANRAALAVALGCPLRECARQSGKRLTLWLDSWSAGGDFRPLFDEAKNGWVNDDTRAAGIAEVYRAALSYQEKQPDGGRAFRLAIESFMESRSRPLGYTLRMLAVMHLLEWLDGATTLDTQVLVEKFGLSKGVAKAVMILRNEVSHNHHDPDKKTDLRTSVEKACAAFEREGIDLSGLGQGNREVGLLNYHFSLVGKLLLERICADVVPASFLPGHGPFPH